LAVPLWLVIDHPRYFFVGVIKGEPKNLCVFS